MKIQLASTRSWPVTLLSSFYDVLVTLVSVLKTSEGYHTVKGSFFRHLIFGQSVLPVYQHSYQQHQSTPCLVVKQERFGMPSQRPSRLVLETFVARMLSRTCVILAWDRLGSHGIASLLWNPQGTSPEISSSRSTQVSLDTSLPSNQE